MLDQYFFISYDMRQISLYEKLSIVVCTFTACTYTVSYVGILILFLFFYAEVNHLAAS